MIQSDLVYYKDATTAQLQSYATGMGLDATGSNLELSARIRDRVLLYPRLKAIQTEIFKGGTVACLMELQLYYMYWQVAEGLEPKIGDPVGTWTQSCDDGFNYDIIQTISDYLTTVIRDFNSSTMASTSGLYWTSDNQAEVKPCNQPYFMDHVWGTPYDEASGGAFFYPPASGAVPEGWDGLGLGVNAVRTYSQPIDYFLKMAPSGTATAFWDYKDIVSTGFPDETESNQSMRSALNSLIIHYIPCSGA